MRVSLDKAKKIVKEHAKVRLKEELPLEDCMGGVLAERLRAAMDQPPFRRSAMDGYAVRREDCMGALEGKILRFKVIGEIDAGDRKEISVGAGEAVRIMTGARVPDGADMVIPQEKSDMGEDYVTFSGRLLGDNISPVGEDFKRGDIIGEEGQKVDACLLACGAAAGVCKLNVYRRPKIAVISTGNELVPRGEPLKTGQIYDSSSIYLSARLREFYCDVFSIKHVGDVLEQISREIKEAVSGADMVITTGGVSVGKRDFLEQAVGRLQGEVLFHGIDIKPGMPTMFSLVQKVPVLSLSGNPYSAGAVFEWLFPFRERVYTEGILKTDFRKKRPVPRIVRGFFDGRCIEAAANQKNGATRSGVGTNCLGLLPAGEEVLAAGEKVLVMLL